MKDEKRAIINALTMVFEFGIQMIVPILLCTLFGVWLGRKVDVNWLAVPFFFVGALAGYTRIYKMIKHFIAQEDAKKEEHVKKD